MAKIYYHNDADMSLIEDKTIGIVGYGSQGHAHALNLHDSGLSVMVGLYEGSSSIAKAEADGLTVGLVEDMARQSDIIMMLIPDHIQAEVYKESVLPHLLPGKTLMFAHGFNIHYDWIQPPDSVDVSMVAPKAPGHRMREVFTRGSGVPGLLAVHQDVTGQAEALGLAYARGVGCTRAGVLETTFKEETETDLFGEQAVLCGGVAELVKSAFETLIEAGYQPESAYFECMHELKLIVDLLYQGGTGVHALLGQRHRRVRRLHPWPRRHRRERQGKHAEDPRRHPGRQFRPRVDSRERRRPPPLQPPARRKRRPPDRKSRQRTPLHDVLPSGRGLGEKPT